MTSSELYQIYMSGGHEKVWREMATIDLDKVTEAEYELIKKIVGEALKRIDNNINSVFKILKKYGFEYKNFGGLNTRNNSYIKSNLTEYKEQNLFFSEINTLQLKPPLLYTEFCSYYQCIDYRGVFKNFEPELLLDALFIETIDSISEFDSLIFDRDFDDTTVSCLVFTPDQFVKENVSGDIGPCILLEETYKVDNYLVNFKDEFKFKFIDYLRFCFQWACFPNLSFASEHQLNPFNDILKEVRGQLISF